MIFEHKNHYIFEMNNRMLFHLLFCKQLCRLSQISHSPASHSIHIAPLIMKVSQNWLMSFFIWTDLRHCLIWLRQSLRCPFQFERCKLWLADSSLLRPFIGQVLAPLNVLSQNIPLSHISVDAWWCLLYKNEVPQAKKKLFNNASWRYNVIEICNMCFTNVF